MVHAKAIVSPKDTTSGPYSEKIFPLIFPTSPTLLYFSSLLFSDFQ